MNTVWLWFERESETEKKNKPSMIQCWICLIQYLSAITDQQKSAWKRSLCLLFMMFLCHLVFQISVCFPPFQHSFRPSFLATANQLKEEGFKVTAISNIRDETCYWKSEIFSFLWFSVIENQKWLPFYDLRLMKLFWFLLFRFTEKN